VFGQGSDLKIFPQNFFSSKKRLFCYTGFSYSAQFYEKNFPKNIFFVENFRSDSFFVENFRSDSFFVEIALWVWGVALPPTLRGPPCFGFRSTPESRSPNSYRFNMLTAAALSPSDIDAS
jgi:hypothetical protein